MRIKVSSRLVSRAECAAIGKRFGTDDGLQRVAEVQHAMVGHSQLLAVGFHRSAIGRRVAAGALRPIHRGVYVAGPVIPPFGEEMAAVLACRGRGWIGHASAAFLHSLPPYPVKPHPVAVVVKGPPIRRPKLRVHRVTDLEPDEVDEVEGIPVTTASRAILDLAPVLTPDRLEQTIAAGYASGATSRQALLKLVDRYPRRSGIPRLRRLLDAGPGLTRSQNERALVSLLRRGGIPEPVTNVRVGKWEVDCLWPEVKLVVEVDALATHTSPLHFERDRRKDNELTLLGYTVIRVTERQLDEDPEGVIATIAAALAQLGSHSGSN